MKAPGTDKGMAVASGQTLETTTTSSEPSVDHGRNGHDILNAKERSHALHEFLRLNLKLVKLHGKRPVEHEWQKPANLIGTPDRLHELDGCNVGMHLGHSGAVSVDIDDITIAPTALKALGIDIDAARDASWHIRSPKASSGGRFTFRAPPGVTLESMALRVKEDPTKKKARIKLEFRAGERMDVLPRVSIHPDVGKPWTSARPPDVLPEMPSELLTAWLAWQDSPHATEDLMYDALGTAPELRSKSINAYDGSGGIHLLLRSAYAQQFNEGHDSDWVEGVLEEHGYTTEDGERWKHAAATGAASLRLIPQKDNLWHSDNLGDPLAGNSDAWLVFVVLVHDGSIEAAERQFETEHPEVTPVGQFKPIVPTAAEIKPTPSMFDLVPGSEDTMAVEMVTAALPTHRWCSGFGWMAFDGACWQRDDKKTVFTHARAVARKTARGFDNGRPLTSAKTVAGVITLAATDQRIVVPMAAWNHDPMLLNTPQGVVDLRNGEVHPNTAEGLHTKVTKVAPDFKTEPKRWLKFLDDTFGGNTALIEFVQRWAGLCLSGDASEQVLLFCLGEAAAGKSTLFGVLAELMGSYAMRLPIAVLLSSAHSNDRHPTDVASLAGVRLALSSEPASGAHLNEGLVKDLTGEATIRARFMRRDSFEFPVTFKLTLLGNDAPRLHGGDSAMVRRCLLLPFERSVPEPQRKKGLLRTLVDKEGSGILAWAVRGAVNWYTFGLNPPDEVRAASERLMRDNDDLAEWLAECCLMQAGARTKPIELFRSFEQWKLTRNEHVTAASSWYQRVERLPGVERLRAHGQRWFIGIKVKNPWPGAAG